MSAETPWTASLVFAGVDAALKAGVLVAAAAGIVRAGRDAGPAARAATWTTALLATLAVPALSELLPARGSGWLPTPAIATAARVEEAHDPSPVVPPPPTRTAAAGRPVVALEVGTIPTGDGPADPSWSALALVAWAAVALVLAGRRLAAIARVAEIARRRSCDPGARLRALLARAARTIGVDRLPGLVLTDAVPGPATFGWLRPGILLPAAARSWSDERVDAVLRHELAHVRRADWALRQLAHLVCVLYWFQPAAWWAARRLAAEQERASDRDVLASGVRASAYARHLLDVAVASSATPACPHAALPMARPSTMEDRLMAVLADRTRTPRRRRALLPVLAVLLLVPGVAAIRTWSDSGSPEAQRIRPAEVEDGSNRARIGELAAEMNAVSADIDRITADLQATVEAEVEAHAREIERHVRESIEPDAARIEEIHERMRPALEEIERIHEQELARALGEIETTVAEIERALEAGDTRDEDGIRALEDRLRSLEVEIAPDADRIRELEASLRGHEAEMREIEATLRPAEDRLRALEERMRPGEARLREIEESLHPHTTRMESAARELDVRLRAEIRSFVVDELRRAGIAPDEAAIAAAVDDLAGRASVDVDDGVVTLGVSRARVRAIVAERFGGALSESSADRIADAISGFRAP